MTRAYVYELTDRQTGKYYVGSSYRKNSDPKQLGVSYFTSSKFVHAIFQKEPNRFAMKILLIGEPDYILDMETALLEKLDARNDHNSYNCHNNENRLNSRKVGEMTKELGIGVHARSEEKMKLDASKAGKISCALRHAKKDENGKSIFAIQIGTASHVEKDERGKSRRMVEVGKRVMANAHSTRDENGKSAFVMKTRCRCEECGYEHLAMIVGKHQKKTGHKGKTKL